MDPLRRVLGPEHHATLASMNGLALVLQARGKLDEAEPLFARSWKPGIAPGPRAPHHAGLDEQPGHGAPVPGQAGRGRAALPPGRGTRARVLGPEHFATLASMNNLAEVLRARGKLDEAEPLFRQVVEAGHRVLGPEHPTTLTVMSNLAMVLQARGKLNEAEPLSARSWKPGTASWAPSTPPRWAR